MKCIGTLYLTAKEPQHSVNVEQAMRYNNWKRSPRMGIGTAQKPETERTGKLHQPNRNTDGRKTEQPR
jgi:hypothetical protein